MRCTHTHIHNHTNDKRRWYAIQNSSMVCELRRWCRWCALASLSSAEIVLSFTYFFLLWLYVWHFLCNGLSFLLFATVAFCKLFLAFFFLQCISPEIERMCAKWMALLSSIKQVMSYHTSAQVRFIAQCCSISSLFNSQSKSFKFHSERQSKYARVPNLSIASPIYTFACTCTYAREKWMPEKIA